MQKPLFGLILMLASLVSYAGEMKDEIITPEQIWVIYDDRGQSVVTICRERFMEDDPAFVEFPKDRYVIMTFGQTIMYRSHIFGEVSLTRFTCQETK